MRIKRILIDLTRPDEMRFWANLMDLSKKPIFISYSEIIFFNDFDSDTFPSPDDAIEYTKYIDCQLENAFYIDCNNKGNQCLKRFKNLNEAYHYLNERYLPENTFYQGLLLSFERS